MSAVAVATAFGGPEVLSVVDEPVAEPGPGEVRISVRASGVNPIDHKRYSGMMGEDPDSLPQRVGLEAAGVVSAVGSGDVSGPAGPISVGDEVIANSNGTPGAAADEWVVPASTVVPKPAQVPWDVAAGLLVTGVTAAHLLEALDVRAGQTLLVHGGAGGVGQLVVQLAVERGATVIATASPARHDQLRALGATPIAYGDGLLERVRAAAPDGVDAAADLVGTDEAVDVSLAVVARPDRVATITAFGRGRDGIQVLGGGGEPETSIRNASRMPLTEAVADGRLTIVIAATYPLGRIADAHRESLGGHATGKIVLIP
ncbi:NADP-dependent oxidoreductase [uncultured Jatrophihabitans sp.]|uniref:NADP-dependent oxidoreductase n=1 Tax=uncultured Jatrophihabitans sp. TaxID=1610747 RepID=UPI0035CA3F13